MIAALPPGVLFLATVSLLRKASARGRASRRQLAACRRASAPPIGPFGHFGVPVPLLPERVPRASAFHGVTRSARHQPAPTHC